MAIERVTRLRAVEYKINYVQRKREIYVYLGSVWVGRIIKRVDDPMRRDTHYAGYLQVPGMWGPVVRENTAHEAKIELSIALRRWLDAFTGVPVEVDERPEREVQGRITRTRPVPATEATRITRSRTRG